MDDEIDRLAQLTVLRWERMLVRLDEPFVAPSSLRMWKRRLKKLEDRIDQERKETEGERT